MENRNLNLDVFVNSSVESVTVEPDVVVNSTEETKTEAQPHIDVDAMIATSDGVENVIEQPEIVQESTETTEVKDSSSVVKDRGDGSVNVISFKNLTQIFNKGTDTEYKLFENFSLDIPDFVGSGQLISIMGASGCGKTRLVRVLCGLDTVQEGTVEVYGKQIDNNVNIPMVFQQYSNYEWMTVIENVMLPMIVRGVKKEDAEKKALELLKLVGLEDRANNYPAKLSGGQQQRISIARCLACDSQIIVFDEATGALDLANKRSVQNTILDIFYNYEKDPTIMNISHSIEEVAYISNRVIILKPNPCEVYRTIDIEYPGEEIRERGDWVFDTPEYGEYVKEITKVMKEIC